MNQPQEISLGDANIKAQVTAWAQVEGYPTPDEAPIRYRWSGWDTVGSPPRLACDVTYIHPDGTTEDLGRVTA